MATTTLSSVISLRIPPALVVVAQFIVGEAEPRVLPLLKVVPFKPMVRPLWAFSGYYEARKLEDQKADRRKKIALLAETRSGFKVKDHGSKRFAKILDGLRRDPLFEAYLADSSTTTNERDNYCPSPEENDANDLDADYHPTLEEKKVYSKEQYVKERLASSISGYEGEPRPEGAIKVELLSNFLSWEAALGMVRDIGYPMTAARAYQTQWSQITRYASAAKAHHLTVEQFRGSRPSQRRAGEIITEDGRSFKRTLNDPEHNFDVPMRRTTTGGGFTEEQITAALRCFRFSRAMTLGVFDVVYRRRAPKTVSENRRIGYSALVHNCVKIRKHIRTVKVS